MPISYKFRYLINDWQQHAIEVLNDKFRQQLRSTDDVLMEFADKVELDCPPTSAIRKKRYGMGGVLRPT